MLVALEGRTPQVAADAYVEASARVIGDVVIGSESSLWFYAVVRGDVERIRIGRRTNLQDHTTVHVTSGRWPTMVGDGVTVGHRAVLHGCSIGDHCLVGIAAVVLDGAEVGPESLIGAASLVVPGTKIPPRSLVLGSPARIVRELRADEVRRLHDSAEIYVETARRYRSQGL
jgi:carbonic anhydrase/acetyltransferase-like protein (isoleucine patch superfamily)